MTATLILDTRGWVVALNDAAVGVLGMCHGQPCHQAVGICDGQGRCMCTEGCVADLDDPRSSQVQHRGWIRGRPARTDCSRAGPHRVCCVELLPLPPEQVEPLTPRQRELLTLAAEGYTDRDMARICGITEDTVRTHLQKARRRLKARSRTEAVARALVMGMLAPDGP